MTLDSLGLGPLVALTVAGVTAVWGLSAKLGAKAERAELKELEGKLERHADRLHERLRQLEARQRGGGPELDSGQVERVAEEVTRRLTKRP